MKKTLAILLTLALLCLGMTSLAEEATKLKIGYLAPLRAEGDRASLCVDAFIYAAQRTGVDAVIMRYNPAKKATSDADGAQDSAPAVAENDPALVAIKSLILEGVDGVVIVPDSQEQALALLELAEASGLPVVVEGLDLSPAYPLTPDPEDAEERPFIANVVYPQGEAAYRAAKWLEDASDSPMLFHCALPEGGEGIRAGLNRALSEAAYLSLEDEIPAEANTAQAGMDALHQEVNSATMFYCILADSAPLASGCATVMGNDGDVLIAALTDAADARRLFDEGVDMLAGEPASLEAVQSLRALIDYLNNGTLPEGENRLVTLPVCTATPGDSSQWIDSADPEAAYDFVFTDDAQTEATAE